jgi:uncharacterized repeat protein (TIGR01451 family)
VNVVVEDTLPAGVVIDLVSGSGGATCNAGVPGDPFQPTTCDFGTLAPAAARTMTIDVTVLPETQGLLHNDARVYADTLDWNNANSLASEDTTVVESADLSVHKGDFPDPVLAGEIVTYDVTITNHGPSRAREVALEDTLPPEVSFVAATVSNGSGVCQLLDLPPDQVVCDLNDLDPGEFVTVFIDALVDPSVPDGTTIHNVASVSSATPDPNAANDVDTEDTDVEANADLSVVKTAAAETGNASRTTIFTIEVTNQGPSDAQDVQVVDTLPLSPETKKVIYIFDNAGCAHDESTNVLTCDFGTLAAGDVWTFDVHIQTKGNLGEITNTAEASTSTLDPDGTNDVDTADILVQGGSAKPSK